MAYTNKIVINSVTGQRIKFLKTGKDTGGKLLEIESTYRPHSKEPPLHYHPYQEEDFVIMKGQMTVRLGSKILLLSEGNTLHVPANTVHSMWNNSASPAVINWRIQPALNTEYFLETANGLASDKKRRKRINSLLQRSLIANKYSKVFRLSRPSFVVQKIFFILLTPIALLIGYRASYKKYFD
jgi:quercetin dioxygenase-like cupin family protein